MSTENFIAFFTVCGFFIGLAFVVIKIDDPFEIVSYLLLTTFFFYLLIHVVIMNFVESADVSKKRFNKEKYEEINDYLVNELNMREKRMDAMIKIKRDLILKKAGKKKNEQPKEKAA